MNRPILASLALAAVAFLPALRAAGFRATRRLLDHLGTNVFIFHGYAELWVEGRWIKATIVGVVAQEAGEGQFLASAEMVGQARDWARAGIDESRDLQLSTSPYTGLFVVARGIDNVSKVRAQITAIGYSTSAPENLIASVRRYLRVVEIVLSAVGIIALVVAVICDDWWFLRRHDVDLGGRLRFDRNRIGLLRPAHRLIAGFAPRLPRCPGKRLNAGPSA